MSDVSHRSPVPRNDECRKSAPSLVWAIMFHALASGRDPFVELYLAGVYHGMWGAEEMRKREGTFQ